MCYKAFWWCSINNTPGVSSNNNFIVVCKYRTAMPVMRRSLHLWTHALTSHNVYIQCSKYNIKIYIIVQHQICNMLHYFSDYAVGAVLLHLSYYTTMNDA